MRSWKDFSTETQVLRQWAFTYLLPIKSLYFLVPVTLNTLNHVND